MNGFRLGLATLSAAELFGFKLDILHIHDIFRLTNYTCCRNVICMPNFKYYGKFKIFEKDKKFKLKTQEKQRE
jgi:hypothetical protein